jgi:hypothetical protein
LTPAPEAEQTIGLRASDAAPRGRLASRSRQPGHPGRTFIDAER